MDDCLKGQTSTVTPAEPGGFPWGLKHGIEPSQGAANGMPVDQHDLAVERAHKDSPCHSTNWHNNDVQFENFALTNVELPSSTRNLPHNRLTLIGIRFGTVFRAARYIRRLADKTPLYLTREATNNSNGTEVESTVRTKY
jgi:hypothetical protein